MRVSIAMATYNGESFLQEQLDSFLRQTRLPDELVVCDDCSVDSTMEILEAFRGKAPFDVRIYRNKGNLGYKKNFEQAMAKADGDIVFLSDQDDVWLDHKIERVLGVFEERPDIWVVVNDAEIVGTNLERTGLRAQGQLRSAGLDVSQFLLGCCMAYRSVLKPLLPPVPDALHGHDGWLNELANTLACRETLPDVCQLYRRHDFNTSRSPTTVKSRATRLALLIEKIRWRNLRVDPLVASQRRIGGIDVLLERLKSHERHLIDVLPSEALLNQAVSRLEQERELAVLRQEIQRQAFFSRWIAALKFFFSGGYSHFEGWKSLVRDVLR